MADYRGENPQRRYTQKEFNDLMVKRFELDSKLHVAGPIEKPGIRTELGAVGRQLDEFRTEGVYDQMLRRYAQTVKRVG